MRNLFIVAIAALLLGQIACKSKDQKTEHGFRFVNHTNGTGPKATNGESVMVHVDTYIGDTLMGSTRASNGVPREYMIPDSAGLGKRVPFLYDAARLMSAGDSASVYEAIDSTIRRFVPASQKDQKEVRYEVKVVEVISKEAKDKKTAEAQSRLIGVQTMVQATIQDYTAGKLNDKLLTLPSGLKILVVEPGTGAAVNTGETVKTNYLGALMDGKMFDNSFQRGQTLDFAVGVGQMIPGFDEGVTKINHGGKAYFFLPYKLAYGDQGTPDGSI
ncbi:MAG: FKBP-type peptidyl-prolyl cis-trans isomerase, partial [Saprospiraceae bacterium]|nr:FKBP-type peptidyl-prolyl cis-trans isomerase [Saprospiraceae bacterium]